ncbi:interferon regulatory factor 8 [Labeo rohita]|uniref:Interferon regulatory factor 8 n=1 Tax=Labeo rohita TaxID=84645 RepID=A0A498LLV6_LABRO|nr:interferon regulatory factor 8 [Labeo rohita]
MNPGGRRLKQWLIEQINSNIYNGLLWEDENRTMFRIPWKHAGKQDYNQEVDASIFKAWAIFKGKFKEGDKAEPATWKTRLRCALNKSPDFEEVTDRSQLDISEPYKVYRIVPEEEQKLGKGTVSVLSGCSTDTEMGCSPNLDELLKEVLPFIHLLNDQFSCKMMKTSNDEYMGILKRSHSPLDEGSNMPSVQEWWQQGSHNGTTVYDF